MTEEVVDQFEAAIEFGGTDVMVEVVADGDRPLRAHLSATLGEREADEDTLVLNVKEVAALHDLLGRTLAAMQSDPAPDPWPPVDVHASPAPKEGEPLRNGTCSECGHLPEPDQHRPGCPFYVAPKEDSEGDEGGMFVEYLDEEVLNPDEAADRLNALTAEVKTLTAERDSRLTKEQVQILDRFFHEPQGSDGFSTAEKRALDQAVAALAAFGEDSAHA